MHFGKTSKQFTEFLEKLGSKKTKALSFWRVFIQEQQLVIKVRTKTFPFWCQLTCLAFLLRGQMNWGLKIYRRAYKTQWFEKKTAES